MTQLTANQLALYLGCEAKAIVQPHHELDMIGLINEVSTNGYVILYSPEEGACEWNSDYIKPLLRPLSDITEEEAIEVLKICLPYSELLEKAEDFERFQKDNEEARIYYWHESQCIDEGTVYREEALTISFDTCDVYNHWGHTNNFPAISVFLLSKHFDLFGFIEQGLAINALDAGKEPVK